jgi:hypothetical protein
MSRRFVAFQSEDVLAVLDPAELFCGLFVPNRFAHIVVLISANSIPKAEVVTPENHPLLKLHHGLMELGRFIGIILRLALVAILFGVPVLILIFGGLVTGVWISGLFGGGAFIGFVLFWPIVGVVGFYVAPHVQPQIRNAMLSLLADDEGEKRLK